MLDPELLERITARRGELDALEEQLAKQLAEPPHREPGVEEGSLPKDCRRIITAVRQAAGR
ncbi:MULTISPECIES: hypothetical protein [unclassified Streptomyces]|uniref:hypothetical protein n=1 Tax=unclassified Streptomyces TaxID=2593676 RepID=UPI00341CF6AB